MNIKEAADFDLKKPKQIPITFKIKNDGRFKKKNLDA
jgi:hypothetical protein